MKRCGWMLLRDSGRDRGQGWDLGIPRHFAVSVDVRYYAQVLSPRRTAMSPKLVHYAAWTSTHATQCKPACSPNQCVNYPTSRAIAALASDYPAQYVAPNYNSFRGRVRWEVRLHHEDKGNGHVVGS